VAAPPVAGKANVTIARFLAELCRVPVSAIRIDRGGTEPRKSVEISDAGPESLDRAILESKG
jgi:uncharacterized protein YggU (UPF0235/DUF167 family)